MLPWLRRRLADPTVIAGAVWLVVLLALFWRLWTPIDGARRTFGWDAQHEYWGDLAFQLGAYLDGELPLWNPFDRTGYPFHADPQAGLLYPVTWVLLGVGAILGEIPFWLLAVKIVLHFWLACFGTWFYLRRRGVHPAACWVGGAIFILSYAFFRNSFSALNWGIAWAPWVLAALDVWGARPDRPRAAVVALTLAMSFLAGAPASFWFTLLVVGPYGAWAVVHGARVAGDRREHRRRALVSGAFAAGLFLAICAAQLQATGGALGQTVRDVRDLGFITTTTFGVDDIAGLLIPRMLGGNTYVGAGAVIWAAVALTAGWTARRGVLLGVAALGVACALGSNADFLASAASAVGPFGLFRRAHRYLYVAQLPIAILAAEGLDLLMRAEHADLRRKIARGALVWGVMAVTFFGVGFAVSQKPNLDAQPLRDAFVLACLSTAIAAWVTIMAVSGSPSRRAAFAWIAAVFLVGDLWFARGRNLDEQMFPPPVTRRDDQVRQLAGVPLGARVYDRDFLGFRPGIRLGIRDLGGYEGDPLALSRFATLLAHVQRTPRDLGHLGVGWLLEAGNKSLKKSAADQKALPVVRNGVRRVARSAPTVFWTGKVEVVSGGVPAGAAALFRHPPGTAAVLEGDTLGDQAASAGALVPTAAAGSPASAPAAVAGRLVSLERNRLVAEVNAPAAGVVVIHEAYEPRWRARVDGEEAAIVPVNVGFRGLLVGPGRHRIEMEYRAGGYLILALMSVLATLGAFALAVIGLRRRPAG